MPPKKKLSKKEKARLEAEQAELLRIEMEKEKLKKLEEERQRKQIEREEAEKRLQVEIVENKERREQLKTSVAYFNNIRSLIDAIREEEKEHIEWEKYMRCNGLPSANCPSDLRTYIHMWQVDIKHRQQEERNWLLKTDERSLLTQDSGNPDLSQTSLRSKQGNLGDLYASRIREVLGILAEVDEAIDDVNQERSTVTDLTKLKKEIRDFLTDYLDEFTYKILSHVERDMEPDKPGVSKHVYTSNVFKSYVWTISADGLINPKDTKIKTDEVPHTEIDFPAIDMQITLPPSVEVVTCALRGQWLSYDHYSDYCPTYRLPDKYLKHLNIHLQTKKEWKKRKEILQTMLNEASKELPVTDLDHDGMPDEPAIPRKVDIDKIYNDYEDELNRARRKAMGPQAFNMGEFDVNLRKYRIIGGVFMVDHLEQPEQDKRLNARIFTRALVTPSELVKKGFHQTYKPPPAPLPGVRRLPEEIEAEMRWIETNLEKLGSMTVELPDSVLWFEPPIACRWETAEETFQSENDEKVVSLSRANSSDDPETACKTRNSLEKCVGRLDAQHQGDNQLPVRRITDFNMHNVPPGLDIYGLLLDFVVPRLPEGYCVRVECDDDDPNPRVKYLYLARNKVETNAEQRRMKIPAPITESIVDTGSPREFHPRFNFKKIIQIKRLDKDEDNNKDTGDNNTGGKGTEFSEDDSRHEGALDNDIVGKSSIPRLVPYMFSQLLADLDQLCELQMPTWNQHLMRISSNLSFLVDDTQDNERLLPENDAPRKLSGIVIIQDSEAKVISDDGVEDNVEACEIESSSEYEDNEDIFSQRLIEDGSNGQEDVSSNTILTPIGKWSTRDVHDTKFNEDKIAIQFRIGRLGIFGFALNRYCNMPYQAWELKPDFKLGDGAIQFSFTASIISLDMTITAHGYCVNVFQGGTTPALTKLIGKTHSLTELKTILIECGVDIFPEEDAFCYTEGSCEKNYVMEMHLYACMSTLAQSHNLSWSRWNLLAGSRTAVLLMRELVENKKPPNHSTLLVTPLRTAVIDCTEVSASFNPVPAQGMDFYADLYQLSQVHILPSSREKQNTMDPVLRENVAHILMSIRPLSFC